MPYQQRLKNLQEFFVQTGCNALLIEDKTNLFYLTGLDLSAGKLLIQPSKAILFVDGRYLESSQKNSPFPVKLIDPPSFETILANPEFNSMTKLGFDSDKTSYRTYQNLKKLTNEIAKMNTSRPPIELIPLPAPLQSLRLIKDENEIEILRHAADLGSQGYDFVCDLLRENISEQEIATEVEIFWKQRGGKGLAFDPIIAFGPNSSQPHYRAGTTKLTPGQVVLIDIGVNYRNYHSDMTRMAFFGNPDQRLMDIHAIVEQAQQAAIALCRPGATIGALDNAARSYITERGYGPNFTHSLGHGVGLDIHEYPTVKNSPPFNEVELSPGMVITIEPGIYLPGLGGIRIEDTLVITQNGCENLTKRSTSPFYL